MPRRGPTDHVEWLAESYVNDAGIMAIAMLAAFVVRHASILLLQVRQAKLSIPQNHNRPNGMKDLIPVQCVSAFEAGQ